MTISSIKPKIFVFIEQNKTTKQAQLTQNASMELWDLVIKYT